MIEGEEEGPQPEHEWARNHTPEGAWEEVAQKLLDGEPAVELWWYGPRTAPNGAWMRDKCRRLGLPEIVIDHHIDGHGVKRTSLSLAVPHVG